MTRRRPHARHARQPPGTTLRYLWSTLNHPSAPAEPGDYPDDPDGDSPDNDEQGNDSNDDSSDLDSQEQQPREQRPQQNQSQRQPQPSRNQNQSAQPNTEPAQTEQINDTSLDQNTGSESAKPQPKKPFNMGLGVGSATIDGNIYNQVALRPEISLGKLGLGLDLVVYIDSQGNIRKSEWDEPSDFIDSESSAWKRNEYHMILALAGPIRR